jgi:hypothetical protein
MEDIKRLVEGAFDMDTLGIKDKVRSAGLSKFYKKDQSDWSPAECKIDDGSDTGTSNPTTTLHMQNSQEKWQGT